jgi:uncharacterized protein YxjI
MDRSKFVVKSQTLAFSNKKTFEILDSENGQQLGTAKDTTGFFPALFGAANIEVRDSSNNALLFTVGRMGLFLKRDQVLDAQGQLIGRFRVKMFSLSGGFHVYDKADKHLMEIQGNMFKAEYKFMTPDRSAEMGSVSRTWGGFAKSLLTGGDTFGVQVDSKFASDVTAKTLIIGAAIALESIFKKKEKA